jgi:hypothetical protein
MLYFAITFYCNWMILMGKYNLPLIYLTKFSTLTLGCQFNQVAQVKWLIIIIMLKGWLIALEQIDCCEITNKKLWL